MTNLAVDSARCKFRAVPAAAWRHAESSSYVHNQYVRPNVYKKLVHMIINGYEFVVDPLIKYFKDVGNSIQFFIIYVLSQQL
jgi:hypothetical protein